MRLHDPLGVRPNIASADLGAVRILLFSRVPTICTPPTKANIYFRAHVSAQWNYGRFSGEFDGFCNGFFGQEGRILRRILWRIFSCVFLRTKTDFVTDFGTL